MEDKMLDWVEEKCREVQELYEFYTQYRYQLQERADRLDESTFFNEAIQDTVQTMNIYYAKFSQGYRDVSQVCHILGRQYLEVFDEHFKEGSYI